jgi:hypothetical protein
MRRPFQHVSLQVPCITCRTFHRFTVARQSEMRSLTTSGIAEGDISSIKILTNVEQCAAGVEWSRTFQEVDRILRGYEFCEFDPASMLIREIRGYYAAPPHQNIARHELVGFDYAGRGYKNVS